MSVDCSYSLTASVLTVYLVAHDVRSCDVYLVAHDVRTYVTCILSYSLT